MGRQLYPMLISTEAPSYTMRFRETTSPQKTDDFQPGIAPQVPNTPSSGTNPLTAKRFAGSLTLTVLGSRLGQRGLTVAGWKVMELHRHAG
jgi:hypothetical protein